ncbi:uncharacterized protein LOC135366363 isoform X2 [Ornithodoros turicata]|uniref:uncharacterized protein LOC135366363 isoform X2 n=1 Tax=Ornithodoros turicata TaxID=34597 RepID=UPI0031387A08
MSSNETGSVQEVRTIPGYLQGYYRLVEIFISLIIKEPKTPVGEWVEVIGGSFGALIEAIVHPKKEESGIFDYFHSLTKHQPAVTVMVVISVFLMLCSLFGGFFFVLLRMAGAFGGRKVQNITSWYSTVLRLLSTCMLICISLNATCIICMWGSVEFLVLFSRDSNAVMKDGMKVVENYLVDTIAQMMSVTKNMAAIKSGLHQNISDIQASLNSSLIESLATKSLESCHLPSPRMLSELSNWASGLSGPLNSPVKQAIDVDIDSLRKVLTPVFDSFRTTYSEMLKSFSRESIVRTEYDYASDILTRKTQDLMVISVAVIADIIELNKSLPLPELSIMGFLGKLTLTDEVFRYLEGYGTLVCWLAGTLLSVVFLSTVVGICCHSEEIPPNKRGFLSNQAGIMIVMSSLVMWLFCSAMMPSTILFMMSGVITEAYVCNPYKEHNIQFLDTVIYEMYVRSDAEPNPNLYNTTMKPSLIMSYCPNNPALVNLTRNQDLKGFENVVSAYNPPKYYERLRNGTAFKATALNTDFPKRTSFGATGRMSLIDLSEKITGLDPAGLPSTPITAQTAMAYAHGMKEAYQKFMDGSATVSAQWSKMDECIVKEMSAVVQPKTAPYVERLENISDYVSTSLGACRSLSDFYANAFTLLCDATLDSMNGFWVSLWLVTFLFSCMIACGLKLSKYFMRMDDYTYGGIELEESVEEDDGAGDGNSVSYAPSGTLSFSQGRHKWRRPRIDLEGKFMKFEINPYQKPDMEVVEAGEQEDEQAFIDLPRVQQDRLREFVPENLAEDLKRAKAVLQRYPRPPIQQQQMMLQQQMMQPPVATQASALAPRRV